MAQMYELVDFDYEENHLKIKMTFIEKKKSSIKVKFELCTKFDNISFETYFLDIDAPIIDELLILDDHFFTEPNIWLTTIYNDGENVSFYLNQDYGEKTSKLSTESGISIRMNVEKEKFVNFFDKLKLEP